MFPFSIPTKKVKDKLTWSCKYFTDAYSIQSQRRQPCRTASSAIYTIQFEHNCAQQCLIQSDVEQLLGAPSVHSFTLVHLISSQLLLKATDLDWIQVNLFTTEAVDNIHLL